MRRTSNRTGMREGAAARRRAAPAPRRRREPEQPGAAGVERPLQTAFAHGHRAREHRAEEIAAQGQVGVDHRAESLRIAQAHPRAVAVMLYSVGDKPAEPRAAVEPDLPAAEPPASPSTRSPAASNSTRPLMFSSACGSAKWRSRPLRRVAAPQTVGRSRRAPDVGLHLGGAGAANVAQQALEDAQVRVAERRAAPCAARRARRRRPSRAACPRRPAAAGRCAPPASSSASRTGAVVAHPVVEQVQVRPASSDGLGAHAAGLRSSPNDAQRAAGHRRGEGREPRAGTRGRTDRARCPGRGSAARRRLRGSAPPAPARHRQSRQRRLELRRS